MLDLWVPLTAYYHQLTPYSSCKVLPVTDGMCHWWNVCQISDKWKSNEMHYHSKVKYAELGKHWFFDGIWCCQFFMTRFENINHEKESAWVSLMYFFKKILFYLLLCLRFCEESNCNCVSFRGTRVQQQCTLQKMHKLKSISSDLHLVVSLI